MTAGVCLTPEVPYGRQQRPRVHASTLGFADYRGNRQYITLGNLSENDRAYLFLIDFSRRQRIKLWGRAKVVENDAALIERLFDAGYKARPERAILFTIEAWDVNCSAHITPRYTEAEIAEATTALRQTIADLQGENARLRAVTRRRRTSRNRHVRGLILRAN